VAAFGIRPGKKLIAKPGRPGSVGKGIGVDRAEGTVLESIRRILRSKQKVLPAWPAALIDGSA
jgi:hypothetical protein